MFCIKCNNEIDLISSSEIRSYEQQTADVWCSKCNAHYIFSQKTGILKLMNPKA